LTRLARRARDSKEIRLALTPGVGPRIRAAGLAAALHRLSISGVQYGDGFQSDLPPLTPLAKALMMLESAISLLTLVLVAARAVNFIP